MNPNMIENIIYLMLGAALVYVSFMSRNRVSKEEVVHHHKNTYINTSTEEVPKKGKSDEDEEELNTFFN